jgi:hypothetical protein
MMSMVGAAVAPDTTAALVLGDAWAPTGAAGHLTNSAASASGTTRTLRNVRCPIAIGYKRTQTAMRFMSTCFDLPASGWKFTRLVADVMTWLQSLISKSLVYLLIIALAT